MYKKKNFVDWCKSAPDLPEYVRMARCGKFVIYSKV